jgi:hypothetical protein
MRERSAGVATPQVQHGGIDQAGAWGIALQAGVDDATRRVRCRISSLAGVCRPKIDDSPNPAGDGRPRIRRAGSATIRSARSTYTLARVGDVGRQARAPELGGVK